MKKMFFLLIAIAAISFTASSQITLKKLELTGNMAVLKTDAGAQYLNIKPITHYWVEYLPTDTIVMISGNNKQFSFAIRTQNEFKVNGVVKPISVASYIAELDAIIAAASSGGGATAVLQQTQVDTLSSRLTTSTALPTNGVKALNVRQVQTTALVGVNIPTVTLYTTDANTVVTTNVTEIEIENMSLTTNANFTYGGQTFTLGFKGNGITPSFYHFKAPYDASSFKYSPFATLIVNAASSSVLVTKHFIQ